MQNTLPNLRPRRPALATRADRPAFSLSPGSSLGVELDLPILDAGTGAGSPTPVRLLDEYARSNCPHPSARWVEGRSLDSFVCERCRAVLEEGWPDHHPEISRWLNEGGAVGSE